MYIYISRLALRGVRGGDRPGDAGAGLLLRQEAHLLPQHALLLRPAVVHHCPRLQVLLL